MERHLFLVIGPAAVIGLTRACRVIVAKHFDVTAKRDCRKLPARTTLRGPAKQFRAEADGKHLDPHAGPTGDAVMAKFMDEHQSRQDGQKWQ